MDDLRWTHRRVERGCSRALHGFRLGAVVVVVALVGLQGCSFSASFDSPPLYRLVSVNDQSVPTSPGFGVTILSGSFELGSDGACLHSQRVRVGTGDNAQEDIRELVCTWSRSGDTLELTFEPLEYMFTMSGVIRGETLVLARDTGVRCVTTPCPSQWVEEYERDRTGV